MTNPVIFNTIATEKGTDEDYIYTLLTLSNFLAEFTMLVNIKAVVRKRGQKPNAAVYI